MEWGCSMEWGLWTVYLQLTIRLAVILESTKTSISSTVSVSLVLLYAKILNEKFYCIPTPAVLLSISAACLNTAMAKLPRVSYCMLEVD